MSICLLLIEPRLEGSETASLPPVGLRLSDFSDLFLSLLEGRSPCPRVDKGPFVLRSIECPAQLLVVGLISQARLLTSKRILIRLLV